MKKSIFLGVGISLAIAVACGVAGSLGTAASNKAPVSVNDVVPGANPNTGSGKAPDVVIQP